VLRFLFGSKDELVRAVLARARRDEMAMLASLPVDEGLDGVARALWDWLASPAHRPVLTLWVECYAASLQDPAGPWSDFARSTVEDWLDLLARAQPPERRRTAAGAAQRTAVLAGLRGAMFDVLATGDQRRTTRAVGLTLDALS
jgi:AcrR family transcriptional regulator